MIHTRILLVSLRSPRKASLVFQRLGYDFIFKQTTYTLTAGIRAELHLL